jgi:hypothetical protein
MDPETRNPKFRSGCREFAALVEDKRRAADGGQWRRAAGRSFQMVVVPALGLLAILGLGHIAARPPCVPTMFAVPLVLALSRWSSLESGVVLCILVALVVGWDLHYAPPDWAAGEWFILAFAGFALVVLLPSLTARKRGPPGGGPTSWRMRPDIFRRARPLSERNPRTLRKAAPMPG